MVSLCILSQHIFHTKDNTQKYEKDCIDCHIVIEMQTFTLTDTWYTNENKVHINDLQRKRYIFMAKVCVWLTLSLFRLYY